MAVHADGTAGEFLQAGDGAHGGGLAGAVGADQAANIAGGEGEG